MTAEPGTAATAGATPGRSRRSGASGARQRFLLASMALIGVLIMLYPPIASWFSAVDELRVVDAYGASIADVDDPERQRLLAAAETYNDTLVSGLIIDPFSSTTRQGTPKIDADALDYLEQLRVAPDATMAVIDIPAIGVTLPVFHGATDEVLRKGVGHLYGSSLPIGGVGSHAVLTGHSGLPESVLFTELHRLERGDEFTIAVLGETLHYRVHATDVIEPTEIEQLGTVAGRDLVTLVTCTPIGVNSHRLIVQAERVEAPPEAVESVTERTVPFPWWVLVAMPLVGGWAVLGVLALRRPRDARATRPPLAGAEGTAPPS